MRDNYIFSLHKTYILPTLCLHEYERISELVTLNVCIGISQDERCGFASFKVNGCK